MQNGHEFLETQSDTRIVIHLAGRVDYLNCQPLKKFLEWNATPGAKGEVVIEFSRCTYVDSTVLGLVAQAAIRMTVAGKPGLVLANLAESPRRAATQLGLTYLAVLATLPELENAAGASPVNAGGVDRATIRAAHETLAQARPENRALFADFLEFTTPQSH